MRSAGDILDLALVDHSPCGWEMAARLWRLYLPPDERLAHGAAALMACEKEDAETLLRAAAEGSGPPVAPFSALVAEASLWARYASYEEARVYAFTCFRGLTKADRAAFLEWAAGRASA